MPLSITHEFLEACQQTGCPVCRLEQRSLERYIENLFYASVNDIKTRERLRASLGFCREHARLTVDRKLGNALGFAIIYNDVITNILRGFESDTVPPGTRPLSALLKQMPQQVSAMVQRVLYTLTPHKHCIVCQQQDKTLQNIISFLIEGLNNTEVKKALQDSDGLCVPHLKKTFESVRDLETGNLLLSIHREKLESLRGELEEFIRKNDYRFKDEGFGTEGDSWRRAIYKLTGDTE